MAAAIQEMFVCLKKLSIRILYLSSLWFTDAFAQCPPSAHTSAIRPPSAPLADWTDKYCHLRVIRINLKRKLFVIIMAIRSSKNIGSEFSASSWILFNYQIKKALYFAISKFDYKKLLFLLIAQLLFYMQSQMIIIRKQVTLY